MRTIVRRIFWAIISIILVSAGMLGLSGVVEVKTAYRKNHEFIRQDTQYDVLFLGTSHVLNGVFPMEMWKEYGITSYNLSGHAHRIPATYWVMMNALDYAAPKVIVVDCFWLEKDEKYEGAMEHESFDSIPLSGNKVRAVFDLFDTMDKRVEYLWNFSTYHGRWWDLGEDDFTCGEGVEKGASLMVEVAKPRMVERVWEEGQSIDSVGVDYLKKILEECEERDIEVLLTYLPFPAGRVDQISARYTEKIAEQYGVNYINFLDLDIVDYETDCADSSSHLNVSGAGKVTDYLGRYISENYDIADHRTDQMAERWSADYERYLSYKIQIISSLESLEKCLMMLTDPNLSCCIYVDRGTGIWDSDSGYDKLVMNLVPQKELSGLQSAIRDDESYLLVADRAGDNVIECVGDERLALPASFGEVNFAVDGGGRQELYIGGGEENLLASQDGIPRRPAVTVVVINNLNGSVVHVGRFYDDYRMGIE